jgi:hypothetical protein
LRNFVYNFVNPNTKLFEEKIAKSVFIFKKIKKLLAKMYSKFCDRLTSESAALARGGVMVSLGGGGVHPSRLGGVRLSRFFRLRGNAASGLPTRQRYL